MKYLKRNPIFSIFNDYFIDYLSPGNISYLWNYGSLLGIVLVLQVITGVTLAMHYIPNIELAFISVEHIMREVNYGWFIRYLHANGASFFFLFVYIHIARGLYYGSYTTPRMLVWSIGVVIFILMMATAFLGYYNSLKRFMSTQSTNKLKNLTKKPRKIYENLELLSTQLKIKEENRNKSGIYLIENKINNKIYIGSAIANHINVRFRNHCIHGTGNIMLKRSINKYGLENFRFIILEYHSGFVHEKGDKKGQLSNEKKCRFIDIRDGLYNKVKS